MRLRSGLVGLVGGLALALAAPGRARGGDASAPEVILRVTCPSEAVKVAVEARRGELLACFDEQVKKERAFSATSVFEWTVQADGRVANASANGMSADFEDPELRDCILARIARWTFPRPGGPIEVTLVAAFSVKPAAPPAGADVDKAALRKAIQAHAPEIGKCYQAALDRDPRLAGKVLLKWVIAAGGTAENVQVADGTTLEDHALHECMKARVASWKFPRPVGGGVATVTYPWILRPQPGP
jgi:hypothetical protein